MTPVVALTATASTTQRRALLQMLRNPTTEISSVNKPNIYYRVIEFNPPSKPGRMILLNALYTQTNHFAMLEVIAVLSLCMFGLMIMTTSVAGCLD